MRHHEWSLFLFQQIQRLDSLRVQAVHDVDDQDGDVAEGATPVPQVAEALVTRSVNDKEAGKPEGIFKEAMNHLTLLLDPSNGRVGGTDLLGDPTRLAILNTRSSQL